MDCLHLYLLIALALSNAVITTTFEEYNFENHPNYHKLDHEDCGFSMAKRIVGGFEADNGLFPWMVIIAFDIDFRKVLPICGGAILNGYYVLTAAHCFDSMPPGKFGIMAIAGVTRKSDMYSYPAQIRYALRVIIHPEYNSKYNYINGVHDDIALIELDRPFAPSLTVSPICLPKPKMTLEGARAFVAGWGTYEEGGGGSSSEQLKFMRKVIFKDRDCAEVTGNMGSGSQLCAAGTPGSGPCAGDSGGPLMSRVVLNGRSRFVVLGVLSYGPSECGVYSPDVYTRVAHYLPFILDNIQKS